MQTPHINNFTGKHIHMIGIGGSSMSGLAEMLIEKGYIISGSDSADGYALDKLRGMGAKITVGHYAESVHGADMVVYTAAILPDNPERLELARLQIPNIERAVLLGQLMEGYKKAIGVCGAHGKTTTTSMLSQVLVESGIDPSIHIGGRLDAIGGSTRIGKSDAFLAEACEFNASFLHMRPTLAVVLNIDADHLDFYRDIDHIEQTFGEFLNLLPLDGMAIGWGDDFRVARCLAAISQKTETYGINSENDWQMEHLRYDETGHPSFDVSYHGKTIAHIDLKVPGEFNALNALAAFTTACILGVEAKQAAACLNHFEGVHRRFELTGIVDEVKLYHDYGHNPTEMKNALSVAMLQPHNRLWAVMQPHTYSRVKRLFPEYLTCTKAADITLVTDIFAAREKDPGDIHASMIVEGMKKNGVNAILTPTFQDTEDYLRTYWQPGDLVLTMGCGNINLLNDQISEHGNA